MLSEHDEFLISRWVDGDLSPEERAHVEGLLQTSDAARAMLREYRQLSGLLRLSRESPPVDAEALLESIRGRIDNADRPVKLRPPTPEDARLLADVLGDTPDAADRRRPPMGWRSGGNSVRRLVAVAAALILATGLIWQLSKIARHPSGEPMEVVSAGKDDSRFSATITGPRTAPGGSGRDGGVLRVEGPLADRSTGPATIDVAVGPPPALAREYPNVRPTLRELYPSYGRIELLPDTELAVSPPDNPRRSRPPADADGAWPF